jgi:hypothetical protein
VTTENSDLTDIVTQDQQQLDQEQGVTEGSEAGPSNQQLLEQIQAQGKSIDALTSQNRGLQGLIDNGLNAIRNDSKTWLDAQINNFRGEQNRDKLLAGLEEDQRPMVEAVLSEMDRRIPVQAEPAPMQNANAQQQLRDQWEPVLQYVESVGLTRTDSRVQLNMMVGAGNQVNYNNWSAFRDHLVSLRAQDMNPAAQTTNQNGDAPVQQRPATANPPVESASQIPLSNLRTEEDFMDAFIMGRFNTADDPNGMQEYTKRMASVGKSV